MKAIRILKTESKSIKKFLTLSGVKVLRCKQDGNGILLTVENSVNSIEKAIKFMVEFNLTKRDGSTPNVICKSKDYADFGSVFHTQIINN